MILFVLRFVFIRTISRIRISGGYKESFSNCSFLWIKTILQWLPTRYRPSGFESCMHRRFCWSTYGYYFGYASSFDNRIFWI